MVQHQMGFLKNMYTIIFCVSCANSHATVCGISASQLLMIIMSMVNVHGKSGKNLYNTLAAFFLLHRLYVIQCQVFGWYPTLMI